MERLVQDLSYAARTLRKNPGFTAVALLTLALGIGANSAIFSVVNGVVLRPLPYTEADRVVMVWNTWTEGNLGLSELEYAEYRTHGELFNGVAAFAFEHINITGDGEAERVQFIAATANLLSVLGVRAVIGRNFTEEEDVPGNDDVVLLSHGLWQRRYGGDLSIVGKTIRLNEIAYTIVGVAPPGFRAPLDFTGQRAELILPLALDPTPDPRNFHNFQGVARLRAGVSVAEARAGMAAVAARLKTEISTLPESFSATVLPVRKQIVGDVQPVLLILLAAVGLVLLIACANVANLTLARSHSRQRELAIRAALGADRRRLLRQLFTESALLAVLGGVLSLPLAVWGVPGLLQLAPPDLPRVDEIGLDARVLLFTGVVSIIAGILFGLIPALSASRERVQDALKEGAFGSTAGGRSGLRRALVIAELALAVMLAVGAGLMTKSVFKLLAVDAGFEPERVLTMQLSPPLAKYPDKQTVRSFYSQLLARVEALPGAVGAGAIRDLPLASRPSDWGIRIKGRGPDGMGERGVNPDWFVVTEGYFESMGIPIRAGRFFDAADDDRGSMAVIINETLARQQWPNESPIGAQFRMSADIDTVWRTVVGVAGDVRHRRLGLEQRPAMYLPHAQFPSTADFVIRSMSLVVRTSTDPLAMTGAVRREVRTLDSDLPVTLVRSMEQVLETSTSVERLQGLLFSAFAAIALLLVSVGIYGVISYSVTQRTRELGVRIALGASTIRVLRYVMNEGVLLTTAGIALGVVGALALSRLLSSLLFGVSASDPVVFIAVPAFLFTVALIATYIPALRATRLDPMIALRHE